MFKNSIKFIGIFIFVAMVFTSCSKKLSSPKIEKLEDEQAILVLNTHLNELNLEMERTILETKNLSDKVSKANKDASKSAEDAKKLYDELASNAGDQDLAKRARKAASQSANDARKADKLNNELSDTNQLLKDYREEIKKTESQLQELKSKIQFVPTTNSN